MTNNLTTGTLPVSDPQQPQPRSPRPPLRPASPPRLPVRQVQLARVSLKENNYVYNKILIPLLATDTTSTTTTTTTTTTPRCNPIFPSTSGLVAYFPMDSSPSYLTNDGGTATAIAVSVTNVAGQRNQSLSFTGTINSYFQTSALPSIGTVNAPFSIALYINPDVLSGTIVHISKYENGTADWCLPFIGFASTTNLAIQIWGGSTANYVLGPIPSVNSWTHVVQTWSSTSGLSLYIDGLLYGQDSTVTTYAASGVADYLTLASTLQAIPYPLNGCSTTGVLGEKTVVGGIQRNDSNQVSHPYGLYIDLNNVLFIADSGNDRVMKLEQGTSKRIIVVEFWSK
ncbi:unnamed protein product [Rotaria sordida]|uniref:Uncharacterized protein n=1 Tax=Rotaria sordida TaxID=392033 RepID=A0A818QD44_9BILA|nr:unnamed protein product [Rotaria sordida]